jgi:hypothetical protein
MTIEKSPGAPGEPASPGTATNEIHSDAKSSLV